MSTPSSSIKLYGSSDGLSPNTLKIRLALIEAELPFEFVPVDLSKGEHRTPEFLRVNSHGKIPAMTVDFAGAVFRLSETNAILWYAGEYTTVEYTTDRPRLLPHSIEERSAVLQFLDLTSMHIYSPTYQYLLNTAILPCEKRSVELANAARDTIVRALDVIERALSAHIYPWIIGTQYTIADISAAATINNVMTKIPEIPLGPATIDWLARVKARPAWQKAIETAPANVRSSQAA